MGAYKKEIIQEEYDKRREKREKGYSIEYYDKPSPNDPKLFMVNCKIGTE